MGCNYSVLYEVNFQYSVIKQLMFRKFYPTDLVAMTHLPLTGSCLILKGRQRPALDLWRPKWSGEQAATSLHSEHSWLPAREISFKLPKTDGTADIDLVLSNNVITISIKITMYNKNKVNNSFSESREKK